MIVTLKQNGYGLRYGAEFAPSNEAPYLWFDSAPDMFADLEQKRVITLSGEPGAGKSHITADVFNLALASGRGAVMLSAHINAGSLRGRETTQETLKAAQSYKDEALVIFDNLDFAVYTGGGRKRRTKKQTDEYCRFITTAVTDCAEAGCLMLATVHSEEWRNNHSNALRDTREQFDEIIEALGGTEIFTGTISEDNCYRLLIERGLSRRQAELITEGLAHCGLLTFRQAYHINPVLHEVFGIDFAAHHVESLKDQKIAGGA